MAKLSAYGRKETYRIECSEVSASDANTTIRTKRVLMSDGTVLQQSSWIRNNKVDHGTGWSTVAKQDKATKQWKSPHKGYILASWGTTPESWLAAHIQHPIKKWTAVIPRS